MKRLAVVTGAHRGLGRALVEELSGAGWSVVAVVRSTPAQLSWAASEDITAVVHDVRSDTVAELLPSINGRPVDVLINNAAQGAAHGELGSIDVNGLMNAMDVNVAGPLRMVQALLPNLLAAPDPIVVNVTSRLGSVTAQARGDFSALSTSYAYKVSKAAQNMLTISLAQELTDRVRCWAVHPGKLATDLGQADASKDPRTAARQLRGLIESGNRTTPRFCSLGEPDLEW